MWGLKAKDKYDIDPPKDLGNGKKVYMVHGSKFEVDHRYDIIKPCGYGAFGFVVGAKDTYKDQMVAIKKCQNVFHDLTDGKRILREIKLLTFLKHENILHIKEVLPPSDKGFDDIYFVSALMDTDLNNVIRSKQRLTEEHSKYFIYQILRGLKYIHAAQVLHRDLKPANLLINMNCDLMIADFGLARMYDPKQESSDMTEYVVTRWYRAPELLLMANNYTDAIDIWSCGCILAEMFNRKPLFPGQDYLGQLNIICEAVGVPDDLDDYISNPVPLEYLKTLPKSKGKPLNELVPTLTTDDGRDLLSKMLVFNPKKRATAAELLKHPYLARLHDPNDEPVPQEVFKWAFDDHDFGTEEELRTAFWEEFRAKPPPPAPPPSS
mmetsp:Transcript_109671/g.189972  ORF Transcript_109671/g.189972 Transcript_109671/m.189972 type:complete len:379 (-) Transcript_109671:310-1446(-)